MIDNTIDDTLHYISLFSIVYEIMVNSVIILGKLICPTLKL